MYRMQAVKVVAIKSLHEDDDDDDPYQAEVYTWSTKSWRDIELNVEIPYFGSHDYQVVYCKEFVIVCYYWDWTCNILSFDVGHEVFHGIYLQIGQRLQFGTSLLFCFSILK